MTTKVRITNIVDDQAHSNGDVIIMSNSGTPDPTVLNPGESWEQWLKDGEPLVITERWPSEPRAADTVPPLVQPST